MDIGLGITDGSVAGCKVCGEKDEVLLRQESVIVLDGAFIDLE